MTSPETEICYLGIGRDRVATVCEDVVVVAMSYDALYGALPVVGVFVLLALLLLYCAQKGALQLEGSYFFKEN